MSALDDYLASLDMYAITEGSDLLTVLNADGWDIKPISDPDTIAISWHIDDVRGRFDHQYVGPLTDDECRDVLARCDKYHDATIGIDWDNIDYHLDDMLRDRPTVTHTTKTDE